CPAVGRTGGSARPGGRGGAERERRARLPAPRMGRGGPVRRRGGRRFGRALAALHRAEAPVTGEAGPYGFSGDNVIGRLPQVNPWRADWPAFFRDARLRPQFERARASGRWRTGWEAPAERLLAQLGDLLPSRPHPSPLHGDLWSGNVLA